MFKKGSRVFVCDEMYDSEHLMGHHGTILSKKRNDTQYLVEFDNDIGGHDGDGSRVKGMPGHCWWINGEALDLSNVKPPNIHTKLQKMCEHLYAMPPAQ